MVDIVGLISGIDMDKSECTLISAYLNTDILLAHFYNLVIDDERAYSDYMSRLVGKPHAIVVSDEIDKALDTP